MSDTTISAAGMRIIRLLVGTPPQTIGELIHATGVTRTAVTEQLRELVEAGLVERSVERVAGRGRPRHLFTTTSLALLLLFANNQNLVVPAVWRAIDEIGGAELTMQVLSRVSQALAVHYGAKVKAREPQKRLKELMKAIEDEGGLVDVIEDEGKVTVSKRSCAFFSMFEEKRTVCSIELEMMSSVVGCPVRRVACRHDGDPCCSFEVAETSGKPTRAVAAS